MKETYVKPTIYVESFALAQSIARGCGDVHSGTVGQSTHKDEYSCAWDLNGMLLFLESNSACDFPMDEGVEIDGICYNNPDGGRTVFAS